MSGIALECALYPSRYPREKEMPNDMIAYSSLSSTPLVIERMVESVSDRRAVLHPPSTCKRKLSGSSLLRNSLSYLHTSLLRL